ncbi:MAG: hypothetical protein HFG61_01165 [Lachnospiraceae bacterium]|nr:hypothetical protein [Lachnospiraceae bacterium]
MRQAGRPLCPPDANGSALSHGALGLALAANPDAHPLSHSGRGFQYTTRVFRSKLAAAGMTPGMPRVGKCMGNRPMGGHVIYPESTPC